MRDARAALSSERANVSKAIQSILFNAVPLLLLSAAYLAASVVLAPVLWRGRRRFRDSDYALALVFPCVGVAAAVLGLVTLVERKPLAGSVWFGLVAALAALVPVAAFLAGFRSRGLALGTLVRAAQGDERSTELDRKLGTVARLSSELTRAADERAVAGVLLREVCEHFQIGFAGLALISADAREARGLLARRDGDEWPWWGGARFDLEHEPSGIASAAFEAAPVAVFDVAGSAVINRKLADAVGAQSAVFVPLLTHERVIGVLAVATTDERRTFQPEELMLMEALAAEAAVALERTRSASELADALSRERLVATIARKLRSELDLDAVLRVAVEETGRALGLVRCFVRLGEAGEPMRTVAEWRSEGAASIGDSPERLPISSRAAAEGGAVAVGDVAALGPDGELLAELGTRSAVATPIVVLDELVGVFALHRAEPGEWTSAETALAEAVAHEVGLALRVANLLQENRERIGQQGALLRAAQVLTGDLELEGVLQRLADQVAQLLQADAADCYLLDGERGVLRCAAVHGLPADLVGFEFPADRGLAGLAIREGKPVVSRDYGDLPRPVPSGAYAGFTDTLVAPMRWLDEVQGVLGVGVRGGQRTFGPAEADVLEAFAGLASLALRNAETFSQRTRQARVQRGFYRIASVLGQSLSRGATLEAVAQAAAEALDGDSAAVLTPRGGRGARAGSHELPPGLAEALEDGLPDDERALANAAAQGRILAAPDADRDDRFSGAWRALGGYRSLLAVPVEAPREQAGGLVMVFFGERRTFTDDDLELARHLGEATRAALERSELFEAERTSRALAQQLARTGSLLATELDPASVLEEVVEQAATLVGADACAIRVLEEDDLVVSAAQGEGAEAAIGTHSPSGAWLSGDVVQSRAPVAIEDVGGDERLCALDPILAAGHAAFLGVPLVGPEGSLHGVLAVYAKRPRPWRPEEVEAMLALGANTSAALSNAELYQQVADEKNRSEAILGNIADGIVAVDRDGKVVLWNAAAEQITGVPAEEAIDRTPAQVLRRTLQSDGDAPAGDRLVSITRGREEVWLSLTEAVMRDPAGAVAGRIFAFRDISADRLVEQMKSDFVSTVSHELRTPLTSIYGFAETLLRQDVLFGEPERRTFLGYIASESQRLTGIVDALLNVARLDTGDLQVNLSPTDIGDLASEVVTAVEDGVSNAHEFVLDLPAEPLTAEADRDKLRQVFSILVDNAVKYSPGGGTVTVGAKRKQNLVEVRVDDEGPGIPHAEQARIFRKFYRGGEGARLGGGGGAGGTGLGLFIAQGLVTAMGGRIWVDSAEGQGASFAFELPAATAT
jgi:PAS domain S-box-containing protein